MRVDSLNYDKSVLVIGAASLDVVGRPDGLPELGTSNPASVRTSLGGVARNVAENLARLSQPTNLISVVGQDELGRQVLEQTAAAGVNVSACLRVAEFSTAAYIGILDQKSDLYFGLDDMRILRALTPSYLRAQKDLFHSSSLVFTDANLPPASLRAVFSIAREAKLPICADATSTSLASRIEGLIPQLFMLTANRAEASVLLKGKIQVTDRDSAMLAAREFVKQGVEIAVIPIGEGGVCYATSETVGHVPAVLTRIVDSTGAGDALTAAIIFGLLNDVEIDEAVRLGVTAASLTLQFPGAVLPGLTLERLYDQLVI